jgi:hypothetical protein
VIQVGKTTRTVRERERERERILDINNMSLELNLVSYQGGGVGIGGGGPAGVLRGGERVARATFRGECFVYSFQNCIILLLTN